MSHTARFTKSIALLVVLACASFGVWADGSTSQPVEVSNVNVQGNVVVVELDNPNPEPRVVTVEIQVTLFSGASESGQASVFVDGKSKTEVGVLFSGAVESVDHLGMTDDPQPF